MPRYHFGKRRYVLGVGRWERPLYKCANAEHGCREKVNNPFDQCWPCTMAELYPERRTEHEPKGAA